MYFHLCFCQLYDRYVLGYQFYGLPLTTEAKGIWRFAGVFPVVERQKEMRAQNLLNARQPANELRRVLRASSLLKIVFLVFNTCNTVELYNTVRPLESQSSGIKTEKSQPI
jgi:hypothetical protein